MRNIISICLSFLLASVAAFAPIVNHQTFGRSTALQMSEDALKTGTVKWFNTMKGFGFILPDDGSPDVFVHQTDVKAEGFRSLADGETVEFFVETDPNNGRTKAVKVTGPGGSNVQGAPFRPENDYDSY